MTFFHQLHRTSPVASDLLVLSLVIITGIGIGRIKVAGIRLGVAGILFSGLAAAHFGLHVSPEVAHFLKDFGLVLFVFALGMQMGPGFFASLRQQGRVLNGYAFALVAGGALLAVAGGKLLDMPVPAIAGLFAGASTNTPALGAAQQALTSAQADADVVTLPALSYAATYPLAIVGIIGTLVLLRKFFRIDVAAEAAAFRKEQGLGVEPLERMNLTVENPNLAGIPIGQLSSLHEAGVVISRYQPAAGGEVRPASPDLILQPGDHLMAVGTKAQLERCRLIIGSLGPFDLTQEAGTATYRRVVLTNRAMLGRTVRELGLNHLHNVTVTRVSRGDLIFTAHPDLRLQFGDMLNLVGDEESLQHATKAVGNAVRMLEETKFAAIFAGILLGVLLGLYPFRIEGLPVPVRLGLAGGPLIVAILLSYIGRLGPLVLHMPINANRALRELGIILFLANVGLLSGGQFVATVFTAQGLQWMGLGLIVTMLPLLIVGWAARRFHQLNFMRLCGLLSGGMTDPPALAFSTAMARNDAPAIAYAAVYPLTMLLRIVAAQIIAQMS